jgi:hypothetical protein
MTIFVAVVHCGKHINIVKISPMERGALGFYQPTLQPDILYKHLASSSYESKRVVDPSANIFRPAYSVRFAMHIHRRRGYRGMKWVIVARRILNRNLFNLPFAAMRDA